MSGCAFWALMALCWVTCGAIVVGTWGAPGALAFAAGTLTALVIVTDESS